MDVPLDGSTILTGIGPPGSRPIAQSPDLQRAHHLVVLEGAARGRSVPLGDAPVTIGRTPPARLVLPDAHVSRQHCEVRLQAGRVLVTDRGSTNGSFVDGERIDGTIVLRVGGTLHVGGHVLKHQFWSERELKAWQQRHSCGEPVQETGEIRIEIDQGLRQLEVHQITSSDHFRDLFAELDRLRSTDEDRGA